MLSKRGKQFTVSEIATMLEKKEQDVRRYIDKFELGSRELGPNNVERRVLNDKEVDELAEIFTLKEKGFTLKNIEVMKAEGSRVFKKEELQEYFQGYADKFAASYRDEIIELQNDVKELKEKEEEKKLLEMKIEDKKDKKIEDLENLLKEAIDRLEEKAKESQKKPIWKFWK